MSYTINDLFEQLNTYWIMSGVGYEDRSPGCYELRIQILN